MASIGRCSIFFLDVAPSRVIIVLYKHAFTRPEEKMANLGMKFDPEVLSRQEVTTLIQSFPPSKTGIRNRALIAVYLFAQLRCNEALDLRPEDIDWERGAITVRRGKGGKRRVAAIPHHILEGCVRPWSKMRGTGVYFFMTHRGGRIHDSYVRKMLKRAATRGGITHRVHTHACRHSGACMLADANVDIRAISAQLGHSNISTTDTYLRHLRANDVVAKVHAAFQTDRGNP